MKKLFLSVALAGAIFAGQAATPQAEYLDRGVVAVKTDDGVFVSWRSLARDGKDASFDVYRDGVKLNDTPITKVTNLTDPAGTAGAKYEVKVVDGGTVTDSGVCEAWATPYMKVHLDRPDGGSVGPNGGSQTKYTYTPDDVSVGDVDGDGVYELCVKWMAIINKAAMNIVEHVSFLPVGASSGYMLWWWQVLLPAVHCHIGLRDVQSAGMYYRLYFYLDRSQYLPKG